MEDIAFSNSPRKVVSELRCKAVFEGLNISRRARFRWLAAIAVGVIGMSFSVARGQGIIITTGSVTADDIRGPLSGTQIALSKNLPGGRWVWGAGWNWGEPFVPANTDSPPQNNINLAEEKTALAVSIAAAGSYIKPIHIRISADLAISGNKDGGGGGLGFWSSMPARDDDEGPIAHFTGLNLMVTGDLQVYEDGTAAGTPVHTDGFTAGQFHNLAYDVNTMTGAISNVVLDGKVIAGLSSAAFKDRATVFAGVLSRQGAGARMSVNNFTVSSPDLREVPADPKK